MAFLNNRPPGNWGVYLRWQNFIFKFKYIVQLVKKILQSCGYVGLSGLALQYDSSNCLMLIPHKNLRNYVKLIYLHCLNVIMLCYDVIMLYKHIY